MIHIDFLTVLVGALVYLIISFFWYSPFLFGSVWQKLVKEKMRKKVFGYIGTVVIAFILSYFLSLVEVYFGATSFWDGIITGFVVYIGFIFPTQILSVVWVKNSFKLFLIDNCCFALSMMVMGGILVG